MRWQSCVPVLVALGLLACDTGNDAGSSPDEVDAFIDALTIPDPGPPPPPDPITLETGRNRGFLGRDRCENTLYREIASPAQLVSFAPNANALAPGMLVTGESIDGGVLSPIGLPLADQVIVVTDIGLVDSSQPTPSYTTLIKKPNVARTNQAINDLLHGLQGVTTPARIASTVSAYHSMEQALLKLGASFHSLNADVEATLERTSYLDQSNVLVAFTQAYYNVSVVPPERGAPSKFLGDWTLEDAKRAVAPANRMPAYVATVTYGRIVLMSVSARESESSLKVAVEAAVSGFVNSGGASLTIEQQHVLEESEFRFFALGGAGEAASRVMHGIGALDSVQALYRSGANWGPDSPGMPISYQLKWLATNDLARMTFTTDYEVRNCTPQRVTQVGFRFQTMDDNKDAGDLVSAEVFAGSQSIAVDFEVGLRGHEWDKNTSQPGPGDASWGGIPSWFTLPVAPSAQPTIDQCGGFMLRIAKSGGKGWRFSPYMMAVLEDGSIVSIPIPSLYNGQTPWQLGNGQVSSRDFPAQGC